MTQSRRGLSVAVICATLMVSAWSVSAHDPTTKVTYDREVVRLIDKHCASCHQSAPIPLTSYDEVRPWAGAIKETVLNHEMPPWPAAPGFGDFANDPTLTPFEASLLAAWADGGAPKGDDRDLPARRATVEALPAAPAVHQEALGCGRTVMPRTSTAIAITPHVADGEEISVVARFASGAVKPLIAIWAGSRRYQPTYRFRDPIVLPKGTVIDVRSAAGRCDVALAVSGPPSP